MIEQTCSNCKDYLVVDQSEGTLVCKNCGLVAAVKLIDESLEASYANNECSEIGLTDTRRAGTSNNTLLSDQGLGTFIHAKYSSLPKWTLNKTLFSKNETFSRGFNSLKEFGTILGLKEEVVFEAMKMFKKVCEEKLTRSRPHEAVISALILIVCRKFGVPVTARRILSVCGAEAKKVLNFFKVAVKFFPLENNCSSGINYISVLGFKLGLGSIISNSCKKVLARVPQVIQNEVFDELCMAASLVYAFAYMSKALRLSLKEIAEATEFEFEESLIRTHYKLFFKYRYKLCEGVCSKKYTDELGFTDSY